MFTKNRNHRIITFARGLQDFGPRGVAASRTRSIMPAATRPEDMDAAPRAARPCRRRAAEHGLNGRERRR